MVQTRNTNNGGGGGGLSSSRFYYNTRYILPTMIGVIVGFGLSLLCTPIFYCDSASFSFRFFESGSVNLSMLRMPGNKMDREQMRLYLLEQQRQIDDFEPRINLEGKPKRPAKPVQKLVRPRYTSVELGVRKKLFVGILSTSRMLTPLASYLNQSMVKSAASSASASLWSLSALSLESSQPPPTFFVNNAEMSEHLLLESTPPGLKVVNFNDDRDHLLALHSIKYVIDNYIDVYDWFFFVTDDTFVRPDKVLILLFFFLNWYQKN